MSPIGSQDGTGRNRDEREKEGERERGRKVRNCLILISAPCCKQGCVGHKTRQTGTLPVG